MKCKNIPNILTSCRIIVSICLLWVNPKQILFVFLYLFCGLTDLLDGIIARRTGCQTQFGAKLDSMADAFMFFMAVVIMIKQHQITKQIMIGILFIFTIKVLILFFSKIKFKRIYSIHTIANKFTGFLFFFCPIAYYFPKNYLFLITWILAFFSSIEEFAILLVSKEVDLNRKSIFLKS